MKLITLIKELSHRDKRNGFYICGIPKCGTTSLEKYLKSHGYNVVREESNYCRWFGVIKAKYQYPNMRVVMIIRDPIERVWSHYNYKRYRQQGDRREIKCDIETALTKYPELLDGSRYNKWIKKWKGVRVLHLEKLQREPDFPKENTNSHPIPESVRLLIEGKL